MLCAKCRQATPRSDDTWCLGCSATESLNSELSAHWHCEGLRALSHEVVVGAVRTVRSLRLISSGLKSAEDSRAALERRRGCLGSPSEKRRVKKEKRANQRRRRLP